MAQDECPPPITLRRYVEQTFDGQPSDEIVSHIAGCPRCQRVLDEGGVDGDAAVWRRLWTKHREIFEGSEDPTVVIQPGESVAPCGRFPQVQGFELIGVLGRGGSGVVYKARQLKLDRLVALKMLSAGTRASSGAIARLRAESAAIARFQHPQVVTIHDVGEHEGIPYLCLELVEGGSLADRLEGMPVPTNMAARLTAALARVVQDAHDRGIIHRDLKPANVLVSGPRDAPLDPARLKLTDFGLAKRLDVEVSAFAAPRDPIIGTPSYMAPEVATGQVAKIGPAVDIYGLGAILYELLTGRPPFGSESGADTIQQVLFQPPLAPSQFNERIAPAIEAICLRCLEKKPAARYATARELALTLEQFAAGEGLVESTREMRSGKRSRYIGKLLASLAAFAVAAVLGIILFQFKNRPIHGAPAAPAAVRLTPPSSCCISQSEHYKGEGKIELIPLLAAFGARSEAVTFDLATDEHRRYLDESLTRNARIWYEYRYGIRYWGPVNDQLKFEVVYRIPFDFPVRSASLYASLNPVDDEAKKLALLQVSTDPTKGWTEVARGSVVHPHSGPVDISTIVRGSQVVFVKAVMKGRDDHDDSAMAQFLRTSILADGHLDVKSPYVFEMRAYDREVPIVTGMVRFDDGRSWALWPKDDGSFTVERLFSKVGKYQAEVVFRASRANKTSRFFDVWVNSPDWSILIKPLLEQVQEQERFYAQGRLLGRRAEPLAGVVDYGDGSGEAKLTVSTDGSFHVEHIYAAPRRYAPRVTIRDPAGRMATEILTCVVVPRVNRLSMLQGRNEPRDRGERGITEPPQNPRR